jgi:hypothetical protein
MLYRVHLAINGVQPRNFSVDCTGSCKSNYYRSRPRRPLLNSTTMIIRRTYKIFIYFILIGQKQNKSPSPVIIEEGQTTQWPKATKGVIRICKSKKNTQRNGQKKKYKMTNNDLQNKLIKLKIE